jgi:hypothetical protein
MATVKAFDEMMGQFIGELATAFPDEPPKTPFTMQDFMSKMGPWSAKMSARDETFFVEENPLAQQLNLHVIWKRPDCSDATKNAIWQYFQSMFMIGTTLSMFPPDTLAAIEAAAENCAKNMKMNPNGQLDEKTLMAGVNSMLNQMMSSGAGNPFASLMGPPPKPQSRKKKTRK